MVIWCICVYKKKKRKWKEGAFLFFQQVYKPRQMKRATSAPTAVGTTRTRRLSRQLHSWLNNRSYLIPYALTTIISLRGRREWRSADALISAGWEWGGSTRRKSGSVLDDTHDGWSIEPCTCGNIVLIRLNFKVNCCKKFIQFYYP